jgi:hypothetical protein
MTFPKLPGCVSQRLGKTRRNKAMDVWPLLGAFASLALGITMHVLIDYQRAPLLMVFCPDVTKLMQDVRDKGETYLNSLVPPAIRTPIGQLAPRRLH